MASMPNRGGAAWKSELSVRARLPFELVQLAQKARRVALDEQRLVVGARVAVERGAAEQCEDASRQLVGGGDDGALVAAALGQRLVMCLELAVVGAGGGVGALDEHGAQRLVAVPGAPGSESVVSDAVRVMPPMVAHSGGVNRLTLLAYLDTNMPDLAYRYV